MWSLRVLSGDFAGKIFSLKEGKNLIGRAPQCDITLAKPGISKQHAQIEVLGDKIILTDTDSRNGTFVDGVAIRSQVIKPGQKLAIYEIICEVVPGQSLSLQRPKRKNSPQPNVGVKAAIQAYEGNLALSSSPAQQPNDEANHSSVGPTGDSSFLSYIRSYIDNVIMPAVYRIPTMMEFKNVVILFALTLVISITALSTIPLTKILKKRIEKTSQQRALTIARTLAIRNQPILAAGQMTGLTTTEANNEPGVDKSFIISLEGRILAPAVLAQRDPEIPFISEARRFGKEVVQQMDDSTIGALVPILAQNERGMTQAMAHAVVIYDMGTLAVDDGQTFSLFIQTLVIALLVGGLVFFFLYKIILYPVVQLNAQVSTALREGQGNLHTDYLFPELQDLTGNIQSLLARGSQGGSGFESPGSYEHERTYEANGLTNLVGFPAIAIRTDDRVVISVNSHFQEQIGKSTNWLNIKLTEVLDQALKLNLTDIVDRASLETNHPATNDIDIDGQNYEVTGQSVFGSKQVNYILIAFIPKVGG